MKNMTNFPNGFETLDGEEYELFKRINDVTDIVYDKHGFETMILPEVAKAFALGQSLPDKDRPNSGVFGVIDGSSDELALRYDLTSPLAAFYAEHIKEMPFPYRTHREGWVFRNEKVKAGRLRSFYQNDADIIGAYDETSDAEMLVMGVEIYSQLLGDEFFINLNSRKLLNEMRHAYSRPIDDEAFMTVIRAMDKLDKIGEEGVQQLLGEGRKDESGDYTEGAKLAAQDIALTLKILTATREGNQWQARLAAALGSSQALGELENICRLAGSDKVIISTATVRGLDYYTGAVWEIVSSLHNSSIGGGGRYDGILARFIPNDSIPCTGFSVGISRTIEAMQAAGRTIHESERPIKVMFLYEEESAIRDQAFSLLKQLWESRPALAGKMQAFIYPLNKGMGAQLKWADKAGVDYAVIIGPHEFKDGAVAVKDLKKSKDWADKNSAEVSNDEWKKNNPHQHQMPVGELVKFLSAAAERK